MSLLRNTESHTWQGFWYLPGNEHDRHYGVLTFEPDEGFELNILSEGFEDPFVEFDLPTRRFQPSSRGGVYGLRDTSRPYDAVFGEVEGRRVTLLDVFDVGGSQKWGGQVPFSRADYSPQALVIGAHIENKKSLVFERLNVSIDFLHIWLCDTGWLEVGATIHENQSPSVMEHFARARVPWRMGPEEGVVLEDGTFLCIDYEGVLPSLKWSAFGYESRSEISTSVRIASLSGLRSLESLQATLIELETLISICMDRECRAHAYEGVIRLGDESVRVDVLLQRRGPIPSTHPTGKYLRPLASCSDGSRFTEFFATWFPFIQENRVVLNLNGFLSGALSPALEPTILMAQALTETFHKSVYGAKEDSLLRTTRSICDEYRERRGKQVTAFERSIDLLHRLPEGIQHSLVPNENRWASALVKARNGISHSDGLEQSGYREANAAAKVATAIVTVHVLQVIGNEEDEIVELTNDRTSLAKAKNLATEYLS